MKKPKISVIVPVYNTGKYLAECLDSVLSQTLHDIEIICVNDGSTDNSADILEQYAKKDNRIKVIAQQNSGVAVARNAAVAAAKSDFIYPLDSDDIIVPYALELLYETITTTNYRVVANEVLLFGGNTGILRQPKFKKYDMYGWHECCVISALFYKSDFEKFGGYKTDFSGYGGDDMDYWLNYIDNGLPMFRLPDTLFLYRVKEKEESVWKNYSDEEFNARQAYKNNLLQKHHPKMCFWVKLWNLMHTKIPRFFYRVLDDGTVKICKIKVPKRKNRYDVIYSIGQNCGCAGNLQRFKLRKCSGPFDWLYGATVSETFDVLLNDFAHFFDKQDFEFMPKNPNAALTDNNHDYYKNNWTKYIFLHDFPAGTEFNQAFPDIETKYMRRIRRFLRNINSKKRVLLVYFALQDKLNDAEIVKCCEAYSKHLHKDIDFCFIENAGSKDNAGQIHKRYLTPHIVKYSTYIDVSKDTVKGDKRDCRRIFKNYSVR